MNVRLTQHEADILRQFALDYATRYHRGTYDNIRERMMCLEISGTQAAEEADRCDAYLADYRTIIAKLEKVAK